LLHKISNIQNLYAHLHTELQISKVNFKTSIQTIDTITTTVTNTSTIPVLYNTLDKEYELDKTYFGYYIGTGITGDFIIVDKNLLSFVILYKVLLAILISNPEIQDLLMDFKL